MFSKKTIEAINYYVYCLVDPRTDEIFYIGKGKGNRVFEHVAAADNTDQESEKLEVIRSIQAEGLQVGHYIVRYGLAEDVALEVEAALIDCLGIEGLTNRVKGHQLGRGKISCEELEIKMCAQEAIVEHDVLVIKINQLYRRDMSVMEIYEATRKYWRASKLNAEKVKYVLGVANGIIRGVFEPTDWYEDEREVSDADKKIKRIAFNGKIAPQDICEKYLSKTLNQYPHTQKQNPVTYIFGSMSRSSAERKALEEAYNEEANTIELKSIDEKAITIKINQKYREGMSAQELYDITNYCWVLSLQKAQKADYVIAVAHGEIKEVYIPEQWYKVNGEDKKRIAFNGRLAEQSIREKYIGKSVKHLYKQGESNPCKYFNIEESNKKESSKKEEIIDNTPILEAKVKPLTPKQVEKIIERQVSKYKKNEEDTLCLALVKTIIEALLTDKHIPFMVKQYIYLESGQLDYAHVYIPEYECYIVLDYKKCISIEEVKCQSVRYAQEKCIKRINCSHGFANVKYQLTTIIDELLKQPGKNEVRLLENTLLKEVSSPVQKDILSISDPVAFRIKEDVFKYLGISKGAIRTGITRYTNPDDKEIEIWWPSLFEKDGWINMMSVDGTELLATHIDPVRAKEDMEKALRGDIDRPRPVFAKERDLTEEQEAYVFKGVFLLDEATTKQRKILTYKKISDTIKI